jgi:hypothetical protein
MTFTDDIHRFTEPLVVDRSKPSARLAKLVAASLRLPPRRLRRAKIVRPN